MLLISDKELESLLTPLQLVDAVEQAMLADERKDVMVPQRMHVDYAGNTYLLMPAYGQYTTGTKLVSVVPANAGSDLPIISGLYSLNDRETGTVLALISASKLTALRTGAIAAVAVRALSPGQTDTIGIIGPGVQSVWIAICVASVRPVKKILVRGRSKKSLTHFKEQMKARLPEVLVLETEDTEYILRHSSVIITATTSSQPVLPDDASLLEGKTMIAMGSYRKDMRELPDAAFQLSRQILIDAPGTRFEVGDVLYPIQQQLVTNENVITLGSVLNGTNRIDSSTKVFKSAGYALFDLFAAGKLYEEAVRRGIGHPFNF